jgi:transketolase
MSYQAHSAHLGSALSCIDILVAAYWGTLNVDAESCANDMRDRLILSKGHAAMSLYVTLAYRGIISFELLKNYAQAGAPLAEHPIAGAAPGIEVTTGSLGHGLSLGVGMALAGQNQGHGYRVFVILSDGECNEGSVWEAALFAAARKLDRVIAIIDYNKWQATGRSNDIMALQPLKDKWNAFGWSAYEVDGHDMAALVDMLRHVPDGTGKPMAVVAHTIKGKGVSFMEDDNNWHYRIPTREEVQQAKQELGLI